MPQGSRTTFIVSLTIDSLYIDSLCIVSLYIVSLCDVSLCDDSFNILSIKDGEAFSVDSIFDGVSQRELSMLEVLQSQRKNLSCCKAFIRQDESRDNRSSSFCKPHTASGRG